MPALGRIDGSGGRFAFQWLSDGSVSNWCFSNTLNVLMLVSKRKDLAVWTQAARATDGKVCFFYSSALAFKNTDNFHSPRHLETSTA